MLAAGPGFVGPRSCLTTQKTPTADGCQRTDLCSLPAPMTEAPGSPSVEGRYANCEPSSGGGSACYCSAGESLFMFHIAAAADDAACADTITSCEPSAVIAATGDPTCQPTSNTTNANNCEADLDCTQPATIDGRPVVADGRLLVQCARLQQGRPLVVHLRLRPADGVLLAGDFEPHARPGLCAGAASLPAAHPCPPRPLRSRRIAARPGAVSEEVSRLSPDAEGVSRRASVRWPTPFSEPDEACDPRVPLNRDHDVLQQRFL